MKGSRVTIIGCGPRIREWRKGEGLKAIQLARMLTLDDGHLTQGSLSDIENGKSNPSALTIRSFLLNTNINIYWMLTGERGEINKGKTEEVKADRQIVHLTQSNSEIIIKRL